MNRSFVVGLTIAICIGQACAESVALRPSSDTGLFSTLPDNNLGANGNFVCGASGTSFPGRGLMRFDVAGHIPAGATIQSASLSVNVIVVPMGGGVGSIFGLHRMLVDWGEGTGTGNPGRPAIAGEATWNNRFHPSTPWGAPGGAVSNDFSAQASATLFINELGPYTFAPNSNLVSDVQQWLSNPSANFGWMLVSQSEDILFTARRFATREDTTNAPVLTIEYTLPSSPVFTGIQKVGGQIQLELSGSPGLYCVVQYCKALGESNWLTLTNIQFPTGITNMVVVDSLPIDAQRFYRIAF